MHTGVRVVQRNTCSFYQFNETTHVNIEYWSLSAAPQFTQFTPFTQQGNRLRVRNPGIPLRHSLTLPCKYLYSSYILVRAHT